MARTALLLSNPGDSTAAGGLPHAVLKRLWILTLDEPGHIPPVRRDPFQTSQTDNKINSPADLAVGPAPDPNLRQESQRIQANARQKRICH